MHQYICGETWEIIILGGHDICFLFPSPFLCSWGGGVGEGGVGDHNQWKSDVFKFILICNCLLYPQIYTGTPFQDVWHRTPTLGSFLQEPQGLPPTLFSGVTLEKVAGSLLLC